MQLNRLTNVRVLPLAAGNAAGLASFEPGPDRARGGLAASHAAQPGIPAADAPQSRRGGGQPVEREVVGVIRLDDFAALVGRYPDALKIDVEGGELGVLHGAVQILARRPVVFLSTHSEALRAECRDFLDERGYSVTGMGGGSWCDTWELLATPEPR